MSDRKSYDPNSREGMQTRLNNYAEELEYERVTSRATIAALTAENAELRAEIERLRGAKLQRVELRPDDHGELDDLVIDDVTMVHMERMDTNVWWIGLYFGGKGDRITFDVRATRKNGLVFKVIETPETREITPRSMSVEGDG